MQEEIEKRTWYERVADSLDFSCVARSAGIDFKAEPKWVLNVLCELNQQAMPVAKIRRPKEFTPREVGRIAGQMCAGIYAIGETFMAGLEAAGQKGEAVEMSLNECQKNQHLPLFKSLLQAMEFCGQGVGALAEECEHIESAVLDGGLTSSSGGDNFVTNEARTF